MAKGHCKDDYCMPWEFLLVDHGNAGLLHNLVSLWVDAVDQILEAYHGDQQALRVLIGCMAIHACCTPWSASGLMLLLTRYWGLILDMNMLLS